jgi:hypothetical protein
VTPKEAIIALRQEGFAITRERDANLWLEPAGAPDWFRVWLEEIPTPPWSNRVLLLRALDLEERPDSGLTVGALPLVGDAYWLEKVSRPA